MNNICPSETSAPHEEKQKTKRGRKIKKAQRMRAFPKKLKYSEIMRKGRAATQPG